jgi:hypothetical protein
MDSIENSRWSTTYLKHYRASMYACLLKVHVSLEHLLEVRIHQHVRHRHRLHLAANVGLGLQHLGEGPNLPDYVLCMLMLQDQTWTNIGLSRRSRQKKNGICIPVEKH